MGDHVRNIAVPEGERPSPAVIAARIDLGAAEYHEHCCPWLMWTADESLFTSEPSCECGGPEMAKAYADEDYVLVRREVLAHLVLAEERLSAASGCDKLDEAREVLSGGPEGGS